MQKNCARVCIFEKKIVTLHRKSILILIYMKTFLKYLGALLVLCGVVCLAIYYFAVPTNTLLWLSLVLELVGILSYILIHKYVD